VTGAELLRLERVTAGYGEAPVVHEVDLSVGAGQIVGLIGPNGSGKTTLVRVASRTLRPHAGRVLVCGQDPYAISARAAARLVAVVPQELVPTFGFTALEVVLMGRAPYRTRWGGTDGQDHRRARQAVETARIEHLAGRTLDRLSGGEKQRVLLAQALVQDAPVMLLDEPTTHLDVRHVVGILDTVRDLAAAGRAVLAIFHDLNLAAGYCDRVVALEDGRVIAEGTPQAVVTEDLLREIYGVEAEVRPDDVTGRPTVLLRTRLDY
jgi:iron complex transport system ATP-binding protein